MEWDFFTVINILQWLGVAVYIEFKRPNCILIEKKIWHMMNTKFTLNTYLIITLCSPCPNIALKSSWSGFNWCWTSRGDITYGLKLLYNTRYILNLLCLISWFQFFFTIFWIRKIMLYSYFAIENFEYTTTFRILNQIPRYVFFQLCLVYYFISRKWITYLQNQTIHYVS